MGNAPINVKLDRGMSGLGVGILTFFEKKKQKKQKQKQKKKRQIPHPRDNVFGQNYQNSPPSGKQRSVAHVK